MVVKDKIYCSWSTIDLLVDDLCGQIEKSDLKFKNIFGLQRGGLIPAVMVSHNLGIPMTKGTISSETLIIDDICDSGVTLDEFYNKHQVNYAFPFNLKTACLHYKPNTSKFIPTFWSGQLETDDWIVYPWERDDAKAIQDYLI
jgi:hypoxanthine phosphoribosyltransferase